MSRGYGGVEEPWLADIVEDLNIKVSLQEVTINDLIADIKAMRDVILSLGND